MSTALTETFNNFRIEHEKMKKGLLPPKFSWQKAMDTPSLKVAKEFIDSVVNAFVKHNQYGPKQMRAVLKDFGSLVVVMQAEIENNGEPVPNKSSGTNAINRQPVRTSPQSTSGYNGEGRGGSGMAPARL